MSKTCPPHPTYTKCAQVALLVWSAGVVLVAKKKRPKGVKVPISLPKTEDCASVYIRVLCVWHVDKSLIEFGCASHCIRIVRIV